MSKETKQIKWFNVFMALKYKLHRTLASSLSYENVNLKLVTQRKYS